MPPTCQDFAPHRYDNLSILDFQRRCIKSPSAFQRDEKRRSINEAAHEFRAIIVSNWHTEAMKFHDDIESNNQLHRSRPLATAVGMDADVSPWNSAQHLHVAAARGHGEEEPRQAGPALLLDLEARSGLADMGARAGADCGRPPGSRSMVVATSSIPAQRIVRAERPPARVEKTVPAPALAAG